MGFVSGGCPFCVCFVSFCIWFVSEFLFGSCPGVRLRLLFASCLFRNRFGSVSGMGSCLGSCLGGGLVRVSGFMIGLYSVYVRFISGLGHF